MTTVWKSKEAKQLDYWIDLAFATGRIKDDTHKCGKLLALAMNTRALNKNNPDALPGIEKDIAERRNLFDTLFERDTAGD